MSSGLNVRKLLEHATGPDGQPVPRECRSVYLTWPLAHRLGVTWAHWLRLPWHDRARGTKEFK